MYTTNARIKTIASVHVWKSKIFNKNTFHRYKDINLFYPNLDRTGFLVKNSKKLWFS